MRHISCKTLRRLVSLGIASFLTKRSIKKDLRKKIQPFSSGLQADRFLVSNLDENCTTAPANATSLSLSLHSGVMYELLIPWLFWNGPISSHIRCNRILPMRKTCVKTNGRRRIWSRSLKEILTADEFSYTNIGRSNTQSTTMELILTFSVRAVVCKLVLTPCSFFSRIHRELGEEEGDMSVRRYLHRCLLPPPSLSQSPEVESSLR